MLSVKTECKIIIQCGLSYVKIGIIGIKKE